MLRIRPAVPDPVSHPVRSPLRTLALALACASAATLAPPQAPAAAAQPPAAVGAEARPSADSAAAARVDELVSELDHPDTPGGVIGVMRDGELVFSRAFGAADLTHGIPFTTRTPTNIGSTSKQFTAFAVALLARRGELSLDDDVRIHLPELRDFGETVTLRHLLTHTSGWREFLNLLAMGGRVLDYDHVGRDELIDLLNRQPELQNAPGSEWNYNNTAFALLAEVVARVGGKPFPEWMRENVFLPLGMDDTSVRADPRTIVPGRSMGYEDAEEEGFKEASDLGGAMGAGGVYTTVEDLTTWMAHLAEPRLGGPEIVDWMTTPYVLTDGDTTSYGLGLGLGDYRGLRRVQHGGADVAHRSTFVFFPELDAGYVVLSNYAAIPGSIASGVAEAFFGEHFEPEEEEAEDEDEAAAEDEEAADPADAEGAEEDDAPSEADLRAFVGRYFSAEVEAFYDVVMEEGALVVRHRRLDDIALTPTGDDAFRGGYPLAQLAFERDAEGSVTGFRASSGRTRGVWFERVEGSR